MVSDGQWPGLRIVLLIGAVAGVAALVAGYFIAPQRFFAAYLVAFLFWSGLSLGCLGWLLLHNMTGGKWGFALQRVFEAGARTAPLMALLFVPLLLNLPALYSWATGQPAGEEVLFLPQSSYLNVPFFIIRAAIYFAVWIALALILTRWSYRSDHEPYLDEDVWQNRVRWSAAGLVLFAFTATFAAFDWLMSLEPDWFSSVFGWLAIGRHALGSLALAILVLGLLQGARRTTDMHGVLKGQTINDMGDVFLATILGWFYLALMQFVVIWSANIPGEVVWYLRRIEGSWLWVVVTLAITSLALPVVLLAVRPIKRRLRFLATVAGLVFVFHLLHIYWLVMPVFDAAPSWDWLHLLLPVGMGLAWLALFAWQLLRHPLLPINHPVLEEKMTERERPSPV